MWPSGAVSRFASQAATALNGFKASNTANLSWICNYATCIALCEFFNFLYPFKHKKVITLYKVVCVYCIKGPIMKFGIIYLWKSTVSVCSAGRSRHFATTRQYCEAKKLSWVANCLRIANKCCRKFAINLTHHNTPHTHLSVLQGGSAQHSPQDRYDHPEYS